jgi:hypothetical protein
VGRALPFVPHISLARSIWATRALSTGHIAHRGIVDRLCSGGVKRLQLLCVPRHVRMLFVTLYWRADGRRRRAEAKHRRVCHQNSAGMGGASPPQDKIGLLRWHVGMATVLHELQRRPLWMVGRIGRVNSARGWFYALSVRAVAADAIRPYACAGITSSA